MHDRAKDSKVGVGYTKSSNDMQSVYKSSMTFNSSDTYSNILKTCPTPIYAQIRDISTSHRAVPTTQRRHFSARFCASCMSSRHDGLSVHDASDGGNALLASDDVGNGVSNLKFLEDSAETSSNISIDSRLDRVGTENIPVAADLGEEVKLEQLKVALVEAKDALVVDDHPPGTHGGDLSALDAGQLGARLEQLHQCRFAHVRHLVWVWLARLVHDVRHWWTGRHQRVAAHVVVLHVVGSLHGVVVGLAFWVVGSHDEVLLVRQTWLLAPGWEINISTIRDAQTAHTLYRLIDRVEVMGMLVCREWVCRGSHTLVQNLCPADHSRFLLLTFAWAESGNLVVWSCGRTLAEEGSCRRWCWSLDDMRQRRCRQCLQCRKAWKRCSSKQETRSECHDGQGYPSVLRLRRRLDPFRGRMRRIDLLLEVVRAQEP